MPCYNPMYVKVSFQKKLRGAFRKFEIDHIKYRPCIDPYLMCWVRILWTQWCSWDPVYLESSATMAVKADVLLEDVVMLGCCNLGRSLTLDSVLLNTLPTYEHRIRKITVNSWVFLQNLSGRYIQRKAHLYVGLISFHITEPEWLWSSNTSVYRVQCVKTLVTAMSRPTLLKFSLYMANVST